MRSGSASGLFQSLFPRHGGRQAKPVELGEVARDSSWVMATQLHTLVALVMPFRPERKSARPGVVVE